MGCDTLTPKDIRLRNIQQTTNPLIVHGNKLLLFMGQGITPIIICRAPDIVSAETIIKDLSYNAVLGRDSNLSPPRRWADALRSLVHLGTYIHKYINLI